ncbi:MAG TPA: 4-alpha-glucanotransferase [Acidobacteriaceae bacterium]|jgi:4-alpha-glucanotransferase|nr:4-alpha-glucanotransferase [Acidobacteriaceae bacterium]
MLTERSAGIILHISSLPSYGGIGDLGPAAYSFADFLAAAKQQYWQVLPLGPTGFGNSPYSALSAFAGNPLFISLEALVDQGWLAHEQLKGLPGADGPIDYERVVETKIALLEQAAGRFVDQCNSGECNSDLRNRFVQFCRDQAHWLDDFARFSVLRRIFDGASWHTWPEEFRSRTPAGMELLHSEHWRALATEQALQFFFAEQWNALRWHCGEKGIRLIGDAAIFVNYDSADVWTHPDIFELDAAGNPLRVSGVPPDYFSVTGQRWGNPLYRWDLLEQHGFDWWVGRIRRALQLCDLIRLDHFRGFEAYWAIPAAEETAVHGTWVKAPGMALFAKLEQELGSLPLIAEDLGVITPEVEAMRQRFHLPGMRVLQFGFADRGAHDHLPHKFEENIVAFTGTHDNDTTLGWWQKATAVEQENLITYLHPGDDGVVWSLIRAAATSVARMCLIPMQDVLGLGSEARMNTPAQSGGNWAWRYAPDALHPELAAKLAALVEVTDRDVPPVPGENQDGTQAAE